jgi:predicted nucleic acid-binding protein
MLLDTSGLLCLLHRSDPFHDRARDAYRQASVRLCHNYVLAEFVALGQARKLPRELVLNFVVDLENNPDVRLVWVDQVLHDEAVALLKARADKTYSLCDAVSFVLMLQASIGEALTTDHHFEQEGFMRLLR